MFPRVIFTHAHLALMREIIESPGPDGKATFIWPRTFKTDYVRWTDPTSGRHENIWSPVRASYFLLRIWLPIRDSQAKYIGSGEFDPEVYRPEEGGWIANPRNVSPTLGKAPELSGLVKAPDRHEPRFTAGLFVTPPKISSLSNSSTQRSRQILFRKSEITELFCRLRDWQEQYNPLLECTSTSNPESRRNAAYLFRDAASSSPQLPPTPGRLKTFWRALLEALDLRLIREGMPAVRGPQGTRMPSLSDLMTASSSASSVSRLYQHMSSGMSYQYASCRREAFDNPECVHVEDSHRTIRSGALSVVPLPRQYCTTRSHCPFKYVENFRDNSDGPQRDRSESRSASDDNAQASGPNR